MALLNKLFQSSSSSSSTNAWTSFTTTSSVASVTQGKRQQQNSSNQSVHSKNYLSQFPFDGRQVRVLLYRESDSQGRRLLFDSNALQKVSRKEAHGNFTKNRRPVRSSAGDGVDGGGLSSGGKHQHQGSKVHSNNFIEVCKEYGYRHNRPNTSDITVIGEMVFGALAMSFCGTSLKVHWLQEPSRILCSQVFLTPMASSAGQQSPYSTMSMSSLATPRTSISSEQGSVDGLSLGSFSMPFSVGVGRHLSLTPSERCSITCPLDVPDQQSLSLSLSTQSDSGRADSGPRYSSTTSNATDSGYSGMSRSQMSSDQWSSSYQYSTRSSLGSVMSEQSDPLRKLSLDSSFYPTSPHFDTATSDGSLQRRISRNLRTSFENEHAMNDIIGYVSDNYPLGVTGTTSVNGGGSEGGYMDISASSYRRESYGGNNETHSNPEMGRRRDGAATKPMPKRAKLGLAVCITMSETFEEEMELFCGEHIALLESMLSRLRASTERAYIRHKDFLQIMYHAWMDTQQWFNDLFTAPRIKCPIWISITTSGNKYSKNVAEKFIKELCWLLSMADTKDTNFFISTMLTAILTHHLGWVATVAAFNSSTSRSETSVAAIEQRAKLLQVSQKHPYNALWAQLGDLYGAIGIPPKLARTVIYGTEKLSVERLLNVLTYFIRCGEVRRSAKREDFSKELVTQIVAENKNEILKKSTIGSGSFLNRFGAGLKKSNLGLSGSGSGSGSGSSGGLSRTQTCKQSLNTIVDTCEPSSGGEDSSEDLVSLPMQLVQSNKKNEIPNVLAFRDSHFVQQELRIGNYLMDTGIEKNSLRRYRGQKGSGGGNDSRIRLMVTTPDNKEMNFDDDSGGGGGGSGGGSSSTSGNVGEGVVEAIEMDSDEGLNSDLSSTDTSIGRRNFFWKLPDAVKEGVSLNDLSSGQRYENCDHPQLQKRLSHLSLSDLITQNSMGKSDRMLWGIDPRRENVSLEEEIHFEVCQKQVERERSNADGGGGGGGGGGGVVSGGSGGGGGVSGGGNGNDVLFVLGENEPLVNLKKSNEDLTAALAQENKKNTYQSLCPLHQRTYDPLLAKKHSGVKFNFEQFPQIATNYMKSKNLNYDLLMEKCSKLEAQEANLSGKIFPAQTTINDNLTEGSVSASTSTECIACNTILNSYQTPSNATELEFETDEMPYSSTTSSSGGRVLHNVNSTASLDTLKSASIGKESITEVFGKTKEGAHQSDEGATVLTSEEAAVKKPTYSSNSKRIPSLRGSVSSVAAKCAAVNEAMHLLQLPVPGIKEMPQDNEPPGDVKLRAGFVPSLFINVSDHYISDVILQGTCASPITWEMNLREDLELAAHSASFISLPAENVAIVADMEKWDVRLLSSRTQCFPYAGGQSMPVGMSQLVASMLETVQAMNSAGISAYECLSFLESKMQEIYLQSESLAAFFLETEFCSLNAVTTALNLSENDVPLLLSIASIHTPQIGKKCGITIAR